MIRFQSRIKLSITIQSVIDELFCALHIGRAKARHFSSAGSGSHFLSFYKPLHIGQRMVW